MRSCILLVLAIFLGLGLCLNTSAQIYEIKAVEPKDPAKQSQCPKTLMKESCLGCHTIPSFKLKESKPSEGYDFPYNTKLIFEKKEGIWTPRVGWFSLQSISDDQFLSALEYFRQYDINDVVIEIHSPGGNLFSAQRIVSMIQDWQRQGGTIETRVYGFALSAGFHVFVAGDKRLVGPQAELMWHEISTFKFLDYSSPSDKEDEGDVLRHLQDVRNGWLASRSKLTKDEIDDKVRKREFWMSGKQAFDYGFADGFLGGD